MGNDYKMKASSFPLIKIRRFLKQSNLLHFYLFFRLLIYKTQGDIA